MRPESLIWTQHLVDEHHTYIGEQIITGHPAIEGGMKPSTRNAEAGSGSLRNSNVTSPTTNPHSTTFSTHAGAQRQNLTWEL